MDNFSTVAQTLIEILKKEDSFKEIITHNSRYAILSVHERICKITNIGEISWG